jgi:myo-inositol-1(or 4)-monophosphatase
MDPSRGELIEFMAISEMAARAGGQKLVEWLGKANVEEKAPGDLVTQADFDSQRVIRDLLLDRFPGHSFLGEEDDGALNSMETTGYCWIVDPLDGTTNFVHQLRSFAVSIALAANGKLIAGCVLDPLLDESFVAAAGLGARLNGQLIRTSSCSEIDKALLVCSLTSHAPPEHPEVRRFLQVLHRAGGVRRLGSAALNFCYVACGRLDGYWAASTKIWDIAAGALILSEAGGVVEHIDGGPLQLSDPCFLATASATLQASLRPLMKVSLES